MTKIGELIRQEAYKWRGEKEITPNQGFYNKDLEARMIAEGWRKGDPWCAFAFRLIWKDAYKQYNNAIIDDLNTYCNPSAVQTFQNFSKRPALTNSAFTISQVPEIGAGLFFRDYDLVNNILTPQWEGHVGVVIEMPDSVEVIKNKLAQKSPFMVTTIEGNTSSSGSREGDQFGMKTRFISYTPVKGLVPLGFVLPLVDSEIEQFIEDI